MKVQVICDDRFAYSVVTYNAHGAIEIDLTDEEMALIKHADELFEQAQEMVFKKAEKVAEQKLRDMPPLDVEYLKAAAVCTPNATTAIRKYIWDAACRVVDVSINILLVVMSVVICIHLIKGLWQ